MRNRFLPDARRAGTVVAAIILFVGVLANPADALRRETLKLRTASGAHILDIEVAETMKCSLD